MTTTTTTTTKTITTVIAPQVGLSPCERTSVHLKKMMLRSGGRNLGYSYHQGMWADYIPAHRDRPPVHSFLVFPISRIYLTNSTLSTLSFYLPGCSLSALSSLVDKSPNSPGGIRTEANRTEKKRRITSKLLAVF